MNLYSLKLSLLTLTLLPLMSMAAAKTDQVIAHDPVMIKEGKTFYVFCTGPGITAFSSTNLKDWKSLDPTLKQEPQMVKQVTQEFAGHLWAPDIQFHNNQYYLYYSASAFGKNTSGIGVSVNKTLDPSSADYQWKELGSVIQSIPKRDDWNAIDPQIIQDEKGIAWMTFGSFWSGLKIFKLNADWTKPAEPQEWYELSERPRAENTSPPQTGAVEAPFIFKKGEYYYLFVSFDLCCRGKDSNYNIRVGRSKNLTGPYLDKDNIDMRKGGGSLVLAGNPDWPGLGHNSVYHFDGKDYLVFHAYDAADKFLPKLKILEMKWDKNQWPEVDAKGLSTYRSKLINKK
jgi:arabinan endo-1,5-alpha-L-arabinosidase